MNWGMESEQPFSKPRSSRGDEALTNCGVLNAGCGMKSEPLKQSLLEVVYWERLPTLSSPERAA